MRTRTKKTVTTSLPHEEFEELDRVSERQHLSRSQAVREAVRWYIGAMRHLPPSEEALPDEAEAIERGRQEFAQGDTVRLEDIQRELGLTTR